MSSIAKDFLDPPRQKKIVLFLSRQIPDKNGQIKTNLPKIKICLEYENRCNIPYSSFQGLLMFTGHHGIVDDRLEIQPQLNARAPKTFSWSELRYRVTLRLLLYIAVKQARFISRPVLTAATYWLTSRTTVV